MILDRFAAFFAATEFSWLDVLDILIVALIIYELLQLIRGTHAVQMALGVLVLALVMSHQLLVQVDVGPVQVARSLPVAVGRSVQRTGEPVEVAAYGAVDHPVHRHGLCHEPQASAADLSVGEWAPAT